DVGSGQLLDVSLLATRPDDRRLVALLLEQLTTEPGDGTKGIVVHLGTGQDRDLVVEQRHQLTQNAALGLPPQSEQNEVVAAQYGVHDRRHLTVVVPDNARKQALAAPHPGDQVLPQFQLDGTASIPRCPKLTYSAGSGPHR